MILRGTSEWTTVGERIRSARHRSGLSVRELARLIEVSPSHVSKVERGLGSFSASVLYAVSTQLHISLDSLFQEPQPRSVSPEDEVSQSISAHEPGIVLRRSDRPAIRLSSGPRWERLTPHLEQGAEFLEAIYDPGAASSDSDEFVRHNGREYGVVVVGTLTIQVGFEIFALAQGDSVSFDSNIPHRFWNATDGEVRAIWFVRDTYDQSNALSPGPSSTTGREPLLR
jgi:transcriptional regulator with XRE-family HTH domain